MEFKAICLFNISTLGVCAHMGMGQDLVHPKWHGLLLKVTSIWQSVGSVNLNFVIFCPPILRLLLQNPLQAQARMVGLCGAGARVPLASGNITIKPSHASGDIPLIWWIHPVTWYAKSP